MSDEQPDGVRPHDERPRDQRPSDAEPEPAITPDGALAPSSTADDGGTGPALDGEVDEQFRTTQHADEADPERLVEGNRVATEEDLEP